MAVAGNTGTRNLVFEAHPHELAVRLCPSEELPFLARVVLVEPRRCADRIRILQTSGVRPLRGNAGRRARPLDLTGERRTSTQARDTHNTGADRKARLDG